MRKLGARAVRDTDRVTVNLVQIPRELVARARLKCAPATLQSKILEWLEFYAKDAPVPHKTRPASPPPECPTIQTTTRNEAEPLF